MVVVSTALAVSESDQQSQSLCGHNPSNCRSLQINCFNYIYYCLGTVFGKYCFYLNWHSDVDCSKWTIRAQNHLNSWRSKRVAELFFLLDNISFHISTCVLLHHCNSDVFIYCMKNIYWVVELWHSSHLTQMFSVYYCDTQTKTKNEVSLYQTLFRQVIITQVLCLSMGIWLLWSLYKPGGICLGVWKCWEEFEN